MNKNVIKELKQISESEGCNFDNYTDKFNESYKKYKSMYRHELCTPFKMIFVMLCDIGDLNLVKHLFEYLNKKSIELDSFSRRCLYISLRYNNSSIDIIKYICDKENRYTIPIDVLFNYVYSILDSNINIKTIEYIKCYCFCETYIFSDKEQFKVLEYFLSYFNITSNDYNRLIQRVFQYASMSCNFNVIKYILEMKNIYNYVIDIHYYDDQIITSCCRELKCDILEFIFDYSYKYNDIFSKKTIEQAFYSVYGTRMSHNLLISTLKYEAINTTKLLFDYCNRQNYFIDVNAFTSYSLMLNRNITEMLIEYSYKFNNRLNIHTIEDLCVDASFKCNNSTTLLYLIELDTYNKIGRKLNGLSNDSTQQYKTTSSIFNKLIAAPTKQRYYISYIGWILSNTRKGKESIFLIKNITNKKIYIHNKYKTKNKKNKYKKCEHTQKNGNHLYLVNNNLFCCICYEKLKYNNHVYTLLLYR